MLLEEIHKLLNIDGRSLGQLPGLGVVGIDVIRADIHTVQILLIAQSHTQRECFDLVAFNQFCI